MADPYAPQPVRDPRRPAVPAPPPAHSDDILEGYTDALEAQGDILEGYDMSWSEVGKQAIQNIPESGMKFFKDIWQAVRHPIETGGTLYDVADGAVRLMVPGGDSPNEAKARMVGKFFADRYSTMQGFKRAVATDPVGVMGDFATALTGGGGLAARAPGVAGQVAGAARKLGAAIDPVNLAGKGAKAAWQGVKNVPGANFPIPGIKDALAVPAGAWTGTTAAPNIQAGSAGMKGGKHSADFLSGMREPAALDRIVDMAKDGVRTMKKAASDAYQQSMKTVGESKKILDFGKIDKIYADVLETGRFKGVDVAPSTQKVIQDMGEVLDKWRNYPPGEFHTPVGLDALKKRIGDIREGTQFNSAERMAVGKVYRAIRDEIAKRAPGYGKAMKDYARVKDLVGDIEHALKIGAQHKIDTSIRALTSIMRNNVNTNFGKRTALAETLEAAGQPTLLDSIAGASMSSPYPRGIQSATTPASAGLIGAGIYNDILPGILLGLIPLSSPRLMGELVHAGGRLAGVAKTALQSGVGKHLASAPARLGANQMGRLEQALREKGMVK